MSFVSLFLATLANILIPPWIRTPPTPTGLTQSAAGGVAQQAQGAAKGGRGEGQGAPAAVSPFWSAVRWVVHFAVLALVLAGLWWLNGYLGVEKLLRSNYPALHPFWLPLLFLLAYLLFWLASALWGLTGPDSIGRDHADVTRAWETAVGALLRAGIDPRQAPLFLVVGRPAGAFDDLFEAEGQQPLVAAPREADAPVRVYAWADRVFVTCEGASVLAGQAVHLREQQAPAALAQDPAPRTPVSPLGGDQSPAAAGQEEADVLWAEEEQRVLGLLVAEDRPRGNGGPHTPFLKDSLAVRQATARLHHLGQLLRRDRKPYCPVNGLLVLLPFACTGDDAQASETATACRYDLTVLHQSVQVQCPVVALVCDMEQSDGFRHFLQRLPSRQQDYRVGQRYPLEPDVDDREIAGMVESGLDWFTDGVLPSLAYNLYRVEAGDTGRGPSLSAEEILTGNGRLYGLVATLRERRKRLARLLTRGLLLDIPGTFWFGGVYFAATGPKCAAFIHGVLGRLVEYQNYVSWTAPAVRADRHYTGWGRMLFVVNLALLLGGPVLAYLFWPW